MQLPATPEEYEDSSAMAHSPVRERMRNAVERESCLRSGASSSCAFMACSRGAWMGGRCKDG